MIFSEDKKKNENVIRQIKKNLCLQNLTYKEKKSLSLHVKVKDVTFAVIFSFMWLHGGKV